MVSAKLLAEMDMKLRALVRSVSPYNSYEQQIRSFGGLNLVFSGDVWQLPPPEGGFLGNMPKKYIQNARKYTPAPNIAHGQSLLWSGPETGVQGVTELYECERTQDLRLQSVQNEFRMAFCGKKPTKHYMDYLRCILAVMSMGHPVATKTFVRNVVHWHRNEDFMTKLSLKRPLNLNAANVKKRDDLVRLLHPLRTMIVSRRNKSC